EVERIEDWADKDKQELDKILEGRPPHLRRGVLDYLQVEFQVLNTLDRKPAKYDEDKVDALEKIAARLGPWRSPGPIRIEDLPRTDPKIPGALWNEKGNVVSSK